uniref:Uncharacterized protein n=1 Tax=Anopheles atroparvus TaxID=41427 RepID=A0A182JEP5_ANOAO
MSALPADMCHLQWSSCAHTTQTVWFRSSAKLAGSSSAITLSPSTLKYRSLCMRSMCRPMCIFCFARYTQYGHWNWGSLPHSHFWWLRSDDFSLYVRPQSGHANPYPDSSTAQCSEEALLLLLLPPPSPPPPRMEPSAADALRLRLTPPPVAPLLPVIPPVVTVVVDPPPPMDEDEEDDADEVLFTLTGLNERSRGNISGWCPSRSVVTSGIGPPTAAIDRRASSWSQVRPAIFVMLKSSAAPAAHHPHAGYRDRYREGEQEWCRHTYCRTSPSSVSLTNDESFTVYSKLFMICVLASSAYLLSPTAAFSSFEPPPPPSDFRPLPPLADS